MNETKPYNSSATQEQQKIIEDFFKGRSLKSLADKYRHENGGKLKEAYHEVGLALLHISWV